MAPIDLWLAFFGAVATVIGGLWTAFVYFDRRKRPPPPQDAKVGKHNALNYGNGLAVSGGLQVKGDVHVGGLPRGAILMLLAGLAVLALAIANVGDHITANKSVVTRGGISDSTIEIK